MIQFFHFVNLFINYVTLCLGKKTIARKDDEHADSKGEKGEKGGIN